MSAPLATTTTTAAVRAASVSVSVIELEIAAESGPGWLGTGAEPVTVSLTAESVRFIDDELHFVTGNTIVRSVPRSEVTALTWRGSPPRGRAKGPYRNSGTLWTEEERARLTAEVLSDLSWLEISRRHERSISAVRREAVQLRLVDEIGRRLDEPLAGRPALVPAPDPAADPSERHAVPAHPTPARTTPTPPTPPPVPALPPGLSPPPPSPSTPATPPPSARALRSAKP
jgi:hypothetical protein